MKIKYIVLLLMTNFVLHSQSIVVIDSLNNVPLVFATIKTNNQIIYTDVHGEFSKSKVKLNDTIMLTYLGYKTKTTVYKGKDTLLLMPNIEQLNELVIKYSKKKRIIIGSLKKHANLTDFSIKPKQEFITIVKPKEEANKYFGKNIRSVSFRFNKYDKRIHAYIKKKINKSHYISQKTKAAIRLNLYHVDSIGKFTKFFQSEPKYLTTGNDTIVKFNITKNINFTKNKIAIGLEMLGHVDDNGKIIIKKDALKPIFNNKRNKYFSQKTYWLRYEQNKMMFISDAPHRVGKKYTRDLAIRIELE